MIKQSINQIKSTDIITCLGPLGSFTSQAAKTWFGNNAFLNVAPSIPLALSMLKKGEANYAFVAVETASDGPVYPYLRAIMNDDNLVVLGELDLVTVQNLIVKPGCKLEDIKVVLSHPQGLQECRQWLDKNIPNVICKEVDSTGAAAKEVAESSDCTIAAISSAFAAQLFELEVLVRGIEYPAGNITRFWAVALRCNQYYGGSKAGLLARGKYAIQQLPMLLSKLQHQGYQIVTVHDLSMKTKIGEYEFYIEVKGETLSDLKTTYNQLVPKVDILLKGIYECRHHDEIMLVQRQY